MKFKKKPIEVEAIQWNGMNKKELIEFAGNSLVYSFNETTNDNYYNMFKRQFDSLYIETNEGLMSFGVGDWVIKEDTEDGVIFYKCPKENFDDLYKEYKTEDLKKEYMEKGDTQEGAAEDKTEKMCLAIANIRHRKYKYGVDKQVKILTKKYEKDRIDIFLEKLKLERKLKNGLKIKWLSAIEGTERKGEGMFIWEIHINMKKNYDDETIQKAFMRMLKDVFSESWLESTRFGEVKGAWIKVKNSKMNRLGD